MKKICFITGTRADYGIMAPIMRELGSREDVELQIIATNMHLSPEFGETITEIEGDGFKVDAKIESLVPGGTSEATVLSMAKVEEGLAEVFPILRPDLVVILGDRYEALAAASAAVVFNIPIAHLHGGEITEGAIDDKFRHAITKLSDYHFAATPEYVQRIKDMGENPEHIFHSGAPGAEMKDIDKKAPYDFMEKTGLTGEPFLILAMHPATLLEDKGIKELEATLEALDSFINQGYKILVTMPNSDPGNLDFRTRFKEWKERHQESVILVESLGARLFHFALESASAIVGNSSAALIEAPSHRLPTVNVGIRQKGRTHGITVLDVPADSKRIQDVLKAALSLEMKTVLMGMSVDALNPYYKENSSGYIARKLTELV